LALQPLPGQELLTVNKKAAPEEMILKVSQLGQFIKRFNYEEDFRGDEITSSFSKKIKRSDYIGLLFNNYDEKFDSIRQTYTPYYRQLKDKFIKFVTDKNYKINRISDSLYSLAVCEISYHGKPSVVRILLKQQAINKGIAWVICDASADFIYDENNFRDSEKFIPPTSNEVNYIHLKSYLNNRDSLACYAYQGYTCNRLSIFFQLLHSGDIQYKEVRSVSYFIADIPGWIIQVQEFNRENDNSGWLISNITLNTLPISDYMKLLVAQTR